jgi:hypothetical protein
MDDGDLLLSPITSGYWGQLQLRPPDLRLRHHDCHTPLVRKSEKKLAWAQ